MPPAISKLDGDTPTLRLLALLEVIAGKDQFFTLQGLVEETGLPKPTLHRMLQQLESAGMLQRDANNRHYATGARLRRLAENLLLNDTLHGARRAVLRRLVEEVGESCNITTLSGDEVLYLDRVETQAPLRFYLRPGSRVPVHCSASGKLFLAGMTPTQRKRLLGHVSLETFTANTLTSHQALEAEIAQVRQNGYAFDNEEFLPGLLCLAVPVFDDKNRTTLSIALQAPVIRMDQHKALDCLPALQRAAESIQAINQQAAPVSANADH